MSEESNTSPSPIQDMTQEKEKEAQNLQEPPKPQEQKREEQKKEEHKVASPLSTSDERTVSNDTSTPLTSEEEENLQEPPQPQEQKERDEDVDVDIISLSSPCVRPARRPVQDSHKIDDDYDSPSQAKKKEIDDNDSHSQGKEKKI
ncbi:hypothetical protein FCV25MIE_26720 [Fagus crenata]